MSYILDALKKVEREKARKTGEGGITSIAGDLFHLRTPPPSRRPAGKSIAVIVLVASLACAATWFALRGYGRQGTVTVPHQKVDVAAPAVRQAPAVPPAPPAPAVPQTSPQPAAMVSTDPPHATTGKNMPHPSPAAPLPNAYSPQNIPAPADIKVSGIAWQEERAARRAVVNGFLLQEGATVSGAKITEIHQERVRFTSQTGTFEVRLDAVTLSGASK